MLYSITTVKESKMTKTQVTKINNEVNAAVKEGSLIVCTFAEFKEICPTLEASAMPYAFNITDLKESDVQSTRGSHYNYEASLQTTMRDVKSGVLLDLSATHWPSGVTDMTCTFEGCTSLTTAPVIPDSVTNMYSTFYDCTSLTTAPEIPNSVTDMSYTFSGCASLTTAPVIPNSVTSMEGTFNNCTSLTTAPEIPDSVTEMYYTFSGCASLTMAPNIPDGVTNMEGTFNGCTSLTIVPNIPNSVTDMNYTFDGCTSLKEITAWNKTTDIKGSLFKSSCFENCTSLESIYVPAGTKPDWEAWFVCDYDWPSNVSRVDVVKEQN